MRKLRRLTEAEVIAQFLRGEFFHKEYDADREYFSSLVQNPNLTDARENEIRRVLLFRRRDTMWWELPDDRQWWEVDFAPEDVEQVSVFPARIGEKSLAATLRPWTWLPGSAS